MNEEYNLAYPDVAIDAILNTAYYLQEAGYIFRGSASDYSGTPSKREWVIAPAGFSGYGLSSAVPQGSIGICLYNGTSWTGKIINVLTLDSQPTRNSQNGVTSGGVAATLDEIAGGIMETFASLLFDDETASADLRTKLSYAVKFSVSDVYQTVTHLNILAATTSKAGLLSAADKVKIDSFLTNLRSLTFTDTTASADQGTQITETLKATIGGVQEVIDSITLLAATSSKAGLLSASDKAYIDALPATLTSLSNSISGALALMQSLVGYYVCDTAAGTAAKTVSATGYTLTNGGCIRIKMNNANTAANVTLNINSTGAKALYYDGAQASASNTWEAGDVLEVYYDGTQYQCASDEKIKIGDTSDADLEFSDPNNNVLLRLKDGNIETKNFNSDTDAPISEDTSDADLEISDPNGNVLLRLEDGNIETKNFNSAKKELDGYKYSIIGDSISTFQGYLPSGYAYFYPKPALSNVSQTWWKRMESFTGLSLLKNCSWSNSEMCGDSESLDNAIAGCSTARINDVSDNGINPDIIIVYIGINDMARNTLGSWDASMSIPNEGIITDFSSAYALAIKKIMVKYPAAEVYCCSLLECPNADYSSTEFPCINSHGESLVEYNNAIKKISLGIGAKFIDVHECGITYWNGPNDNFLDNTHPNAKGAYILGKYIANSILNQTLLKL